MAGVNRLGKPRGLPNGRLVLPVFRLAFQTFSAQPSLYRVYGGKVTVVQR